MGWGEWGWGQVWWKRVRTCDGKGPFKIPVQSSITAA